MNEKRKKIQCNICRHQTYHEVLFQIEVDWNEEIDENYIIFGSDNYRMLRCLGCDSICLMHDHFHDRNLIQTKFYPPKKSRGEPKWLYKIRKPLDFFNEDPIYNIMQEIYIALHNQSCRLACMGLRSLLEYVMKDKVGDLRTFADKVAEFHRRGFISGVQKNLLLATIDAGHATVHRSWNPSIEDLNKIMDIIENVIENVYILAPMEEEIKNNLPPRTSNS